MTINGRLLLLILVTGLFVRVWTANDRSQASRKAQISHATTPEQTAGDLSLGRTGPAPCETLAVALEAGRNRDAVASRPAQLTMPASGRIAAIEESWTDATCPIPLPEDIAAGSYRIVDDAGRVARLEVSTEAAFKVNGGKSFHPPELSIVTWENRRWFFVRLQTPPAEARARSASLTEAHRSAGQSRSLALLPLRQPLFSRRKFDFTGYVPAESLVKRGACAVRSTAPIAVSELPAPR